MMAAIPMKSSHPSKKILDARTRDDDWTGLSDAAERKKRQNRLHQRAWRRRKAQKQQQVSAKEVVPVRVDQDQGYRLDDNAVEVLSSIRPISLMKEVQDLLRPHTRHSRGPLPLHPFSYWERLKAERDGRTMPATNGKASSPYRRRLIPPMLPYLTDLGPRSSAPDFHFPLSPDHQLIVLIQFNALRAALTNLSILSLQHRMPLECGAAFHILPFPSAPPTIPPALRPTAKQLITPHDPWIDMVPFPAMRDNLIALGDGVDEDDFCEDALGGLYEGYDEVEARGLVVWGEPWAQDAWEVSEGFAHKWARLLVGCDVLIEATQRYRLARGEEKLVIEV